MTLILTAALMVALAVVFALPAKKLGPVKVETIDYYGELSKGSS